MPTGVFWCCRYLAGQPPPPLYPGLTDPFIPPPPPSLSKLAPGRRAPPERRASPSSLPGRLNRALCLGTIPSLTRTGKGSAVGRSERGVSMMLAQR